KVNIYVQHSREQMAEFYNEPRNRFLNSNVDLATQRDVVERLHLARAEPEGVTYAEVDANAFLSLWCTGEMPQGPRAVAHARRGSVVWSIHTDRKAVGHIAKTVGVRAPLLGFRHAPNTSTPHKSRTSRKPITGSWNKGFVPKNIASIGHSIGGNLAVSRA